MASGPWAVASQFEDPMVTLAGPQLQVQSEIRDHGWSLWMMSQAGEGWQV